MQVKLAGFNVDTQHSELENATPETIAAAYARISRRWDSLADLRKEAIDKRGKVAKSINNIVHKMGHSSIQEHAVFNFDIEHVSRLLVECIQHSRLASYTERSYRYCKMDPNAVYYPELDPHNKSQYSSLMEQLFSSYESIRTELISLGLDEQKANEDARYVTPLASLTSLGMTINARNLCKMIKRLRAAQMPEHKELADLLEKEAAFVAPALIRHTEATEHDVAMAGRPISKASASLYVGSLHKKPSLILEHIHPGPEVNLDRYIAGTEIDPIGVDIPPGLESEYILELLQNMGPHDLPPRAFETVVIWAYTRLSASAYAQLKRHRMCTQVAGPYSWATGYMVPPSMIDLADKVYDTMTATRAIAKGLADAGYAYAAPYCVVNSCERWVSIVMNLRELYHFCRLRQDQHAQWEIRSVADQFANKMIAKFPNSRALSLLCGKDKFEETRNTAYL